MIALSTSCAPAREPLDRTVLGFRELQVRAVALHRPARAPEAAGIARVAKRVRVAAVFGAAPGADVGAPVLVVEGGPAGADREQSLEELCRRLHALRGVRVALRTPPDDAHHPAPGEVALVREAVRFVGYWHDLTRTGAAHLEAAARYLEGASGHPLEVVDLTGVRDALPRAAPFVIACPSGTERDELDEALRCARGVFPE